MLLQSVLLANAATHRHLHASTPHVAGTAFLWIFWPSFNAALQADGLQLRAIVNTTLSLSGSVLATFFASFLIVRGR